MTFETGYQWRQHKRLTTHKTFDLCWPSEQAVIAACVAHSPPAIEMLNEDTSPPEMPTTRSENLQGSSRAATGVSLLATSEDMPTQMGVLIETPLENAGLIDEADVIHVELVQDSRMGDEDSLIEPFSS